MTRPIQNALVLLAALAAALLVLNTQTNWLDASTPQHAPAHQEGRAAP